MSKSLQLPHSRFSNVSKCRLSLFQCKMVLLKKAEQVFFRTREGLGRCHTSWDNNSWKITRWLSLSQHMTLERLIILNDILKTKVQCKITSYQYKLQVTNKRLQATSAKFQATSAKLQTTNGDTAWVNSIYHKMEKRLAKKIIIWQKPFKISTGTKHS